MHILGPCNWRDCMEQDKDKKNEPFNALKNKNVNENKGFKQFLESHNKEQLVIRLTSSVLIFGYVQSIEEDSVLIFNDEGIAKIPYELICGIRLFQDRGAK